jgi:putative glutathione S-transferase
MRQGLFLFRVTDPSLHKYSTRTLSKMSKRNIVRDCLDEVTKKGAFDRKPSTYRAWVSKDHPKFPVEGNGRYHLFVSMACPWANRVTMTRALKGLEKHIGLTIVSPTWQKTKPDNSEDSHAGWVFHDGKKDKPLMSRLGHGSFQLPDTTPCPFTAPNGSKIMTIRDLYDAQGDESSKYTVPVLWDTKNSCIVNNESSELMRMLNEDFMPLASGKFKDIDLYPESKRKEIDELNDWIYPTINNGVYRCGFATTQEAYNEAVGVLFDGLDRLEAVLAKTRFLTPGHEITEADIRLFVTLARFDEVYVVYFKTNKKMLLQYPNIRNYMRDMFQIHDGILAANFSMVHCKTHYFTSHPQLNTYAIIPAGPDALGDMQKAPEGRMNLK